MTVERRQRENRFRLSDPAWSEIKFPPGKLRGNRQRGKLKKPRPGTKNGRRRGVKRNMPSRLGASRRKR
jgi:hypothetical protein